MGPGFNHSLAHVATRQCDASVASELTYINVLSEWQCSLSYTSTTTSSTSSHGSVTSATAPGAAVNVHANSGLLLGLAAAIAYLA